MHFILHQRTSCVTAGVLQAPAPGLRGSSELACFNQSCCCSHAWKRMGAAPRLVGFICWLFGSGFVVFWKRGVLQPDEPTAGGDVLGSVLRAFRATGQRNVERGQMNVESGFVLWQLRQGMDADGRREKLYRCNLE
ncbi:hypothetical protein NDU88_007473 [Pleurodeles waltl]|uniref:Uncharacterized protein n=1 Tax=Pleurodeles waltl TaxID=8319 RepID=A0AAV7U1C6_PLEWA|nr:hypothetical protein NDU88_007473 [Pleurodeles waltl]